MHLNRSTLPVILFISLLFLAFIPIPAYSASVGDLTVTSEKVFKKTVIQVTVTDTDLASGTSAMPLVTVNKDVKISKATVTQTTRQLPMYQTVGGSWIGFVTVDRELTDLGIPSAPSAQDPTPPTGGFDDGVAPGNEIILEPDIVGRANQMDNDGNTLNDVDVHNIIATVIANQGDIFTITYHDANPSALISVEIEIDSTEGVISLDKTTYPIDARVHVTVADRDLNIDPTTETDSIAADSITLSGVTGADEADIELGALTETGPNTGVFTSSTTIPDALRLEVMQIVYTDTDAPDGQNLGRSASAIITSSSGIVTLDKEEYRVYEEAKVKLTDPDLNKDSDSYESTPDSDGPGSVRITSSTDHNGFILVLDETGKNTGIFEESIDFKLGEPPSISPHLKVSSGDTIAVIYADALTKGGNTNVQLITTATIKTFTGSISLDKDIFGPAQIATVTLNDPDENLDRNIQDIISYTTEILDVRSQWTGKPEPGVDGPFSVTLIETGANTGRFEGTFNIDFEVDHGVSGPSPILKVVTGATIIVTYHDQVNAEGVKHSELGHITDQEVYARARTYTGLISLDKSSYVPGRSPNTPSPSIVPEFGGLITISIVDPDRNLNIDAPDQYYEPDILLIEVKDKYGNLRTSYIDGVTVLLKETGSDTGEFEAEHRLLSGVQTNDIVTVYYMDDYDDQGNSLKIKRTASIVSHSGVLSMDSATVTETSKIVVTVEDQDWNFNPSELDMIPIGEVGSWGGVDIWTSTTREEGGVQISLTETGPDTGIFKGSIILGINIEASTGDTVTVRYNDEQNNNGIGVKQTATAKVTMSTGKITLDKSTYPINGKVIITIVDSDRNTDPEYTESIGADEVKAKTTSWLKPNQLDAGLVETGTNTGIFRGSLQLRSTPPDPVPEPEDGVIYCEHGDGLTVTYVDPKSADGKLNVPITATATTAQTTAKVAFNKSFYHIDEPATITITEPDENKDSEALESILVLVASDSDLTGIWANLLETGPDTGTFSGKVSFTLEILEGSLQVRNGDKIVAKYTDENPNPDDVPLKDYAGESLIVTAVAYMRFEPEPPLRPDIRILDINVYPTGEVKAGDQVQIVSSISNEGLTDQPLLYIVQIKDSEEHVVFLSFISGTLPGSKTLQFGLGWQPPVPDDYLAEAFAWRSWTEPEALAYPVETLITVEEG